MIAPLDPTPEQIRERAAVIRRGWTEQERLKRMGLNGKPKPWTPPVVAVGACGDWRTIEDVIAADG